MDKLDKTGLQSELKFRASRSSGPGGQSVNKVSTKVELLFDIRSSRILSETQKEILLEKLKNRINTAGVLYLTSEETRSQFKNKELTVAKFLQLLDEAFQPVTERKTTKLSNASKEKRLKSKKILSAKKDLRKPPDAIDN